MAATVGLFGSRHLAPPPDPAPEREGVAAVIPALRRGGGPAPESRELASRVRWLGRVDTTDEEAPRFSWSYSGFAARFSGTALSVEMSNEDEYFFRVIIDGRPLPRFEVSTGIDTYELVSGLPDGEHTLELHRETEGKYGVSTLLSVDGSLLAPPPAKDRLIEVIGDSISAGYGNLGVEHHAPEQGDGCHYSYATESAFDTYAAMTARALDADLSVVGLSGWGVSRDKDHLASGTVPLVYDRSVAHTTSSVWDFRARAQVVIINLGTNDFAGPAPFDPGVRRFTRAYRALVDEVRVHYPDAWIFCALGPLLSDDYPPHARVLATARAYLQSVIARARAKGDHRISLLELPHQGSAITGCDWHPSRAEHEKMAAVVVGAIKSKLDW